MSAAVGLVTGGRHAVPACSAIVGHAAAALAHGLPRLQQLLLFVFVFFLVLVSVHLARLLDIVIEMAHLVGFESTAHGLRRNVRFNGRSNELFVGVCAAQRLRVFHAGQLKGRKVSFSLLMKCLLLFVVCLLVVVCCLFVGVCWCVLVYVGVCSSLVSRACTCGEHGYV